MKGTKRIREQIWPNFSKLKHSSDSNGLPADSLRRTNGSIFSDDNTAAKYGSVERVILLERTFTYLMDHVLPFAASFQVGHFLS